MLTQPSLSSVSTWLFLSMMKREDPCQHFLVPNKKVVIVLLFSLWPFNVQLLHHLLKKRWYYYLTVSHWQTIVVARLRENYKRFSRKHDNLTHHLYWQRWDIKTKSLAALVFSLARILTFLISVSLCLSVPSEQRYRPPSPGCRTTGSGWLFLNTYSCIVERGRDKLTVYYKLVYRKLPPVSLTKTVLH